MFTTLVSAGALLSALAVRGVSAQDAFTIDTPVMTQCQSALITWTSGAPPFDLVVVPSDAPCDSDKVLADLGDQLQNQSITWNVNLPAGTQVMLSLVDANENEAWSGTITVGGSDDSSCLAATSSSSVAPLTSANVSAVASGVASSAAPPIPAVTPATTLTVPADFSIPADSTPTDTAPVSESSEPAAVPIGAANAGVLPNSNSASVAHKIGGSFVALAAVAAFFVSM
ncbi:uncharacterized protein PHACADRAFT_252592 [Phanerochaete carnosa HHB-10118-sp]|uniref:Uncharacterized protein n=1 Tax=Phanerochaete carnosa (strain HHB-10118-sp) TaxID=650164 RepID=K5WGY6_PHACS|nr:uncharacterized protein PHACADRAFT_252592 [Phanerochaete carnosa HHB-10118-sp]EKM58339.1 hypothetical protein PHACADRAFT_252592 [Phanerochaete carnosa HHB-10118-sp]